MTTPLTEKEKSFVQSKLGNTGFRIIDSLNYGTIVKFEKLHQLSFLKEVRLLKNNQDIFTLKGFFRSKFPPSITIKKTAQMEKLDSESSKRYHTLFDVSYQNAYFYETVLKFSGIKELLDKNRPSLLKFFLCDDFFTAELSTISGFWNLLMLVRKFHQLIFENEKLVKFYEVLYCENCGAKHKLGAKFCSSCRQPLTKCIICLSNFKEKEDVIKTPCCSSLIHLSHLISWFREKDTCPKCKKDIRYYKKYLSFSVKSLEYRKLKLNR